MKERRFGEEFRSEYRPRCPNTLVAGRNRPLACRAWEAVSAPVLPDLIAWADEDQELYVRRPARRLPRAWRDRLRVRRRAAQHRPRQARSPHLHASRQNPGRLPANLQRRRPVRSRTPHRQLPQRPTPSPRGIFGSKASPITDLRECSPTTGSATIVTARRTRSAAPSSTAPPTTPRLPERPAELGLQQRRRSIRSASRSAGPTSTRETLPGQWADHRPRRGPVLARSDRRPLQPIEESNETNNTTRILRSPSRKFPSRRSSPATTTATARSTPPTTPSGANTLGQNKLGNQGAACRRRRQRHDRPGRLRRLESPLRRRRGRRRRRHHRARAGKHLSALIVLTALGGIARRRTVAGRIP